MKNRVASHIPAKRSLKHASIALTLGVLALLIKVVLAATVTWNAAAGAGCLNAAWSTANCWGGGTAPATGDDVVLAPGSGRSPGNYDLGAGVQLRSITETADKGVDTTYTGGPIVLQSGGSITEATNNEDITTFPGITLNGPTTFSLTGASQGLRFGAVTGTGPLTLSSTGLGDGLQLTVADTYTGATTVAGTSEVQANVNGAIPTGSALTVNTGSSLKFSAASTIGSLAGAGTVTMVGANALTAGADNTDTTFSGVYQNGGGAARFVKAGTGMLTFSGTNTYTGLTTITGGTLQIGAGGTTGSLAGSISNNAALAFNRSNALTYAGAISGSGTVTQAGSGTLTLSGANSYSGGTVINAGVLAVAADANLGNSAGAVTFGGDSTLRFLSAGSTFTSSRPFTLNANATFDASGNAAALSGPISGGGSLIKTGSSQLTLTGTNTYSGGTTINGTGYFQIGDSSTTGAIVAAIANNAYLVFSKADTTGITTLTNGGTTQFSNSTSASTITATNADGGALFQFLDQSTAGSAQITNGTGSGLQFRNSSTAGTAVITTNDGTGVAQTTFTDTSTGGSARFITNGTGVLDFSGTTGPLNNGAITAGSIEGSGNIALGKNILTVGSNNLTTRVSGVISGDLGGLTKVGTGRLTLSGANTYSGATIINGGALNVDGTTAGFSTVTVNSGATLGGTGIVNGPVIVKSGGTLSPGASPGTLGTGNLTMASGSTLAIELNGIVPGSGYDQVSVSGTVTLGGATLVPSVGFAPTAGQTFTILVNDDTDAIVGTFDGLPEGGTFVANGRTFQITYTGGTGNDVVLTVLKLSQTITFGALANKSASDPAFTVSATASSGFAVTFSSLTPTVCTVSAATVTLVGAGTCSIAADQPGDINYSSAPQVIQSFGVGKLDQTITFGALPDRTLGDAAFGISATASSGLSVAFSSATSAVCTVSGSTVTLVAAGTCTIAANQAGNGTYNSAPQVTQSFSVASGSQTITFAALPTKNLGDPAFTVSATASSGLTVTFSSTTPTICTVSGATVTLRAVGLCTIAADQAGNAAYTAAPQVKQSFAVNGPSDARMALDIPTTGTALTSGTTFAMAGWAVDRGAGAGVGVDVVDLWAFPFVDGRFLTPTFLGEATVTQPRPDVGGAFGAQFSTSGWRLDATGLSSGRYRLGAYAHSAVTATFNNQQFADVTVSAPTSTPAMSLDVPGTGATLGPSFLASGWAIDAGAPTGVGVDAVHLYAYPIVNGALGTPVFLAAATVGGSRGDVGAAFGSRFTPSGFAAQVASGLSAGRYRIAAYAHSTLTGTFNQLSTADVSIATGPVADPRMAIDQPPTGSSRTQPFLISGWAIDLGAPTGTGIDAVHVWAFRVGTGASTFVGAASYGATRGDIASIFGSRFGASGYSLSAGGLAAGTYDIGVYVHSTVTGTFNQVQFVRVTVN